MSSETQIIRSALNVLDLPVLISYNEIKCRYYELSKKHHPDLNNEDTNMADINNAYAILKQYIFNYRFRFSDEEIAKQFPMSGHDRKFRF